MILADCHTHSAFSSDSEESLENQVLAAVNKGLKTLCITEHFDPDYPDGEFRLDTPAYKAEFERLRGAYSDKIELLFGVELGLLDYLGDTLTEYTAAYPFDFVIGSSHLIEENGRLYDPYFPEYFENHTDHNGVVRYFESILANIRAFGGFDVYGHLDYIVRYTKAKAYSPAEHAEIIDEILKLLLKMGKGIELNTAGLKYGLGWAHPHPEILRRWRELGGELITVGSDAHRAEHIAYDFDTAREILIAAGFNSYAVFRNRKAELLPL